MDRDPKEDLISQLEWVEMENELARARAEEETKVERFIRKFKENPLVPTGKTLLLIKLLLLIINHNHQLNGFKISYCRSPSHWCMYKLWRIQHVHRRQQNAAVNDEISCRISIFYNLCVHWWDIFGYW